MPLARRAGFTLPDLLVAIVLLGLVGAISTGATLRMARILRGVKERAGLQGAFETGGWYLASELSDLARGDLRYASADSIEYRAPRLAGLACSIQATEVRILMDRLSMARLPQPGRDSLLLYRGARAGVSRDSVWIALPIVAVSSGQCDGRAALRIATILDSSLVAATASSLTPVRTFEIMQARLYQSQGERWLGARSVSAGEVVQPLTGPFDAGAPTFRFLTSNGAPAGSPDSVRGILLTLRGQVAGWQPGSAPLRDSAVTRVAPPNLIP